MTTIWMAAEDTALIGVDLTGDFVPPDGALMVKEGDQVIPVFNEMRPHFRKVIWTKEEHPAGHIFFASSHLGKKPLDTIETDFGTQYLWPDHCIKGTPGAEFHPDLDVRPEDDVVVKGTDPTIHAYSAVYMDDRKTLIRYPDGLTLPEKLRAAGINKVVVSGLAYDFCAGMTAYDLAKEGFEVIFVKNASRSIDIPIGEGRTTIDLMDEMLKEAGVTVVTLEELPAALGISASPPANVTRPAGPAP
jgi:nicotinamidase/pyrazinamidase